VLGNGVVIDPEAFLEEVRILKQKNIAIDGNLLVSDKAHIIFPYHRAIDKLRDEEKGRQKIGTTGKGIGPCYADKVARCGIRVVDLFQEETLKKKLQRNIKEKNIILTQFYHAEAFSFEEISRQYLEFGKEIKKYACNCARVLNEAIAQNKSILFEGAQGTLLDVDHGTYPFVTSSCASAGGACIGTGVGPTKIDKVIGVMKAYTTRVGEGPLPTQFPDELMAEIQTKGKEFGATTGRPRRCGWFDAAVVRHAVQINALDEVVVTKLDVLDTLREIKIATHYKYKGEIFEFLPSDVEILWNCEPVYEVHPGWLQSTSHIRNYQDLPINAQKYLLRLMELIDTRISMVSVGSEREQTLWVS
jgi:adenylosuccinate synthase